MTDVTMPPSPERPPKGGLLESIRVNIVAITGVLLVVPAMFGAGSAAYQEVHKITSSTKESVNARLFRKYFNVAPLVRQPVSISTKVGDLSMTYSIFREGEIHVEYGNDSQWFEASPVTASPSKKVTGLLLEAIPSAMAQPSEARIDMPGAHVKQYEALNGNELTRVVDIGNDRAELTVFDIRSGKVSQKRVTTLKEALTSKAFSKTEAGPAILVPEMKVQTAPRIGTP